MIISELSAKTGVSARSLRYYEQQGLVTPARSDNGYRQYRDEAVQVVTTIRSMYEVGFSTEEVRAVLPCATGQQDKVDAGAVRSTVLQMRDGITARIEQLLRTRETLSEFLNRSS